MSKSTDFKISIYLQMHALLQKNRIIILWLDIFLSIYQINYYSLNWFYKKTKICQSGDKTYNSAVDLVCLKALSHSSVLQNHQKLGISLYISFEVTWNFSLFLPQHIHFLIHKTKQKDKKKTKGKKSDNNACLSPK